MSTEKADSNVKLTKLFKDWKDEHKRLDGMMLDLFEWMNSGSHRQSPPYREAVERLKKLLELLNLHFAQEAMLNIALAENHGGVSCEIAAVGERIASEHQTLSERLQSIIEIFSQPERDSAGWPEAVVQFNLFYDVLEQHEEQEENSVQWLALD